MRILVCGDREWGARTGDLERMAAEFAAFPVDALIIEGGAPGADQMARALATFSGFNCVTYQADWSHRGRRAGPERNQRMLDEGKPDLVLAFHHDLSASKGTADMVRRATSAGVEVRVVG
jgi:hypothetical protein